MLGANWGNLHARIDLCWRSRSGDASLAKFFISLFELTKGFIDGMMARAFLSDALFHLIGKSVRKT